MVLNSTMQATANRLEFAPPPTPGIFRALVLAVLAHSVLVAALTWGVNWKRSEVVLSAEAELWAAVPQQAAPKLVEAPPPVVKLVPPEVKQVEPPAPDPSIVTAREKRRLEEEKKAEDKKLLEDKKKAELAAKRKEALQAQADENQRQENIKRMAGLAGASGSATATGSALQSAAPSASYGGKIITLIKRNTTFADSNAGRPTVVVLVKASVNGAILSRSVVTPSNNKAWDDAVLKAIDKMESVPRDTDGKIPDQVLREGLELRVSL
jgi:colicin import membrane protein